MIILNEKEYAEECLTKYELNTKPFHTLSILAKYYYHYKGYRKKKITALLTEYIERCFPEYRNNKLMWEDTIEKLAKNAKKYKLHEIDGVSITSDEMDVIDALNDEVLKRLAFTLLCLAKLGNLRNPNNNGWVNNDTKEIFDLARVSCTSENRYIDLGILGNLGLLEFPKRLDNLSVRITFIKPESKEVLFVRDFRELGYEYLNYKGGNFTRCERCGRLFRNNKRKDKKYCTKCAGYQPVVLKKIQCADCGKTFEVDARVSNKIRCDECQLARDKEKKKEINKRYYEKTKQN